MPMPIIEPSEDLEQKRRPTKVLEEATKEEVEEEKKSEEIVNTKDFVQV